MRKSRTLGWILSALVLTVYFSPAAQMMRTLPGTLSVARGQTAAFDVPFPLVVESTQADASSAQHLSDADARAQGGTATISLFGLLPLREVDIEISDDLRLYPGGQAVGVALHTKGVLVVGTSDLTGAHSPARLAGIKPGDIITAADGRPVESTQALTDLVAAYGAAPMQLTVMRGQNTLSLTLQAKRDGQSGEYRIELADEAGNKTTYSFTILIYFDGNSWLFFILVLGSCIAVVIYLVHSRKHLRVR